MMKSMSYFFSCILTGLLLISCQGPSPAMGRGALARVESESPGALLYSITLEANGHYRSVTLHGLEETLLWPGEGGMPSSFTVKEMVISEGAESDIEIGQSLETPDKKFTITVSKGEVKNVYTISLGFVRNQVIFLSNSQDPDSFRDNNWVEWGELVENPGPPPNRSGYQFLGWYKSLDSLDKFDFSSTAITEETTIYARWDIMFEFNSQHGIIEGLRPDYVNVPDGELIIPAELEGVRITGIAGSKDDPTQGAFSQNDKISAVYFEEGVVEIGAYAFYQNTNLTRMSLPETLHIVGASAFQDCSSLQDFVLPKNVTFLGGYAFAGNTSLRNILIPGNDVTIGDYAFAGNTGLREMVILSGTKIIPQGMLKDASNLRNLILPDSVWNIGDKAFQGVSRLSGLTIPASVTQLGNNTFNRMTGAVIRFLNKDPIDLGTSKPLGTHSMEGEKIEAVYAIGVPEGSGKAYREKWGNALPEYIDIIDYPVDYPSQKLTETEGVTAVVR